MLLEVHKEVNGDYSEIVWGKGRGREGGKGINPAEMLRNTVSIENNLHVVARQWLKPNRKRRR